MRGQYIAYEDWIADRGSRGRSLRLQGLTDWSCASIQADRGGVVMAGRQQVRGLALRRYRGDPTVISAGVDAVAPLSRRHRKREPSACHHPLDQLANRHVDGAAGP